MAQEIPYYKLSAFIVERLRSETDRIGSGHLAEEPVIDIVRELLVLGAPDVEVWRAHLERIRPREMYPADSNDRARVLEWVELDAAVNR